MSFRVLASVIAAGALVAAGCASAQAPTEVQGECAEVFGSRVCTWATVAGTTLVEAGATIPVASIEAAPAEVPMVWPPVPVASIPMPAVVQEAGFSDLTVDWEAGGHPPGAFMTPHFDFHFYTITPADIAAIDCVDTTKPSALPAGYVLPDIPLPPEMAQMLGVPVLVGLCVPKMGMHAIVGSEVERTDPFDGTMVVGYHGEKPIFVEPMISKAMLLKRASFDLPVPTVAGLSSRQPTAFRAEYDAAAESYRFVLSGFGATP